MPQDEIDEFLTRWNQSGGPRLKAKPTPPPRRPKVSPEQKFQWEKEVIDPMIRAGATSEQIAAQRSQYDAARGVAPKLPKASRYRQQEDILYDFVKSNPNITNQEIESHRRSLSGMTPGAFKQLQGIRQAAPQPSPEAGWQAFEALPISEQIYERATSSLARGGGSVSAMARRAAGVGMGLAAKATNPQAPYQTVDFPQWREYEERKRQGFELEKQRRIRPTLGNQVIEGIGESIAPLALGGLGMMAGGGSLPAAMGTMGTMAALQADWSHPRRAAVETAANTLVPMVGSIAGAKLAAPILKRVANPVAQQVINRGSQALTGGVAAGAQNLGEQFAWGPRNQRTVSLAQIQQHMRSNGYDYPDQDIRTELERRGFRVVE